MSVERPYEVRVKLSEEEDELLTEAARDAGVPKSTLMRLTYFDVDLDQIDQKRPSRYKVNRSIGPFRCLICHSVPLSNVDTLGAHLHRMHSTTLKKYRAEFGEPQILSKEEAAEPVVVTCPEGCGVSYSSAAGTRWPQSAMIAHMRARHAKRWRC